MQDLRYGVSDIWKYFNYKNRLFVLIYHFNARVCAYTCISIPCLPSSFLFIPISIQTEQCPSRIKNTHTHMLPWFCILFALPHPFFDLYSHTPLHVLSPIFSPLTLMNPFQTCFLYPPCSNKIALVKITNDFHVAKSNGQFSVFIIFGLSVNLFYMCFLQFFPLSL